MLLITSDVKYQQHDEDGKPNDKTNRMKQLEFESKANYLSDFLYLKRSMHRDQEDGSLCIIKIVKVDLNNNLYWNYKSINSSGMELGMVLYDESH